MRVNFISNSARDLVVSTQTHTPTCELYMYVRERTRS